jgi:ABC-type lipoprotein export system ATPase subunit/ABC-type antimicrobial peptide transport system permease subunit
MIRVEHLDKYFNKGKKNEIHVLNDVTLEFPSKGLVILLGDSGSGKTTLLNVLGGLDKTNRGSVQLDDKLIEEYNPSLWDQLRRDEIGYIFQNYCLIPTMTVFENVAMSLRLIGVEDETILKERVEYILQQVGMLKFRKRHATQLSGGQQQRVAIARALVKSPNVIIADEPTGNLDSKNTVEVMNIIKKISQDRLVILVTHERNIASFYADRIIEISDGKLKEDYENESSESLVLEKNDDIYLKDFKEIKQVSNVSLYCNDETLDLEKDVSVSMIYKNGTLLLDVSGVLKKVKLVTSDSGISIKDEHYIQEDKSEIMKTDFKLSALAPDAITKKKDTIFTTKESLKSAFLSILQLGKVERILLLGFFVTGIITAFAASILGNTLFGNQIHPKELENYVSFGSQTSGRDYDYITSLGEGLDSFYLNVYDNEKINLSSPSIRSDNMTYSLNGYLDLVEHVKEEDVLFGRLPENDFEFVVDVKTYTSTDGLYNTLAKNGIWKAKDLIGEQVISKGFEFTIVGVVDTNAFRIYGNENTLVFLSHTNISMSSRFIPLDTVIDEITLVHGDLPEPGSKEMLVPESWVITRIPEWAFDREQYNYHDLWICGSYDDSLTPYSGDPYIGHATDIEFYIYRTVYTDMDIYSSEPQKTLDDLLDQNYAAKWSYGTTLLETENALKSLHSILYISVLIILFSGLGVYYLMRSNMLARIYNISVFRALGISRRSIRKRYIFEILIITTLTTLIGYLFTCFILIMIQDQSYLKNIVYVNGTSVLFGIVVIYVINLIFGILSIEGQLRKTPTELLNNYDL